MENKIVTMSSRQFGNVRKIYDSNKVLFCASDIAKALGYARPNDAISAHCRATVKRRTPISGKMQEINFIPEADVYRLICHSKLPSAIEFEKWVFEETVPKAVRKEISEKPEQLTLETAEYHYFDKTYKGQPVLTTKDIEYFTGISIGVLNYHLRGDYFIHGKDYFRLEGSVLKDFKAENPNVKRTVNSPYNIVTKAGFIKLLKQAGRTVEMPKCFEEVKKNETVDYILEIKNFNKSDYITAINVLRAVIYSSKGSQKEYDGKKDPLNMLETYQKDINACTLSIKRICSFLSAGYGTDF